MKNYEEHHQKSCEIWNWVRDKKLVSITTNHVIDELATLLARRTSYDFAARKIYEIYDSELPVIFRPDQMHERNALNNKYADQRVSFTDCLSFVVMKQSDIRKVFTFDRHFSVMGFEVIPSQYQVI
ncbi:MAG: type II toxin-antitoxin system VapC family toxin [Desulfobacteraceae bacterium]|nr:type II toxin-antitoxin system VapC family toxin [Desulfobacteraceae bacterium]